MKKPSKTQLTTTFSVRENSERLKAFDRMVAISGANRNETIVGLMKEYMLMNSNNSDFESINIYDNKEILGYEKTFFSQEDAEFFIEASETGLQPSLKGTELENSPFIAIYKETGVKYSFSKIGFVIYCVWHFSETRDEWNLPSLELFFSAMAHNKKSGEIKDITSDLYLSLI